MGLESSGSWSWDTLDGFSPPSINEGPRNTAEWAALLDELPDGERWDSPLEDDSDSFPSMKRKEIVVLKLSDAIFTVSEAAPDRDVVMSRAQELYKKVDAFASGMFVEFFNTGEVPEREKYLTDYLTEIFRSYDLRFDEFVEEYGDSESVQVWLAGVKEAFDASAKEVEKLEENE